MKDTKFLFLLLFCLCAGVGAKSQYYYYNDKYYENEFLVEFGATAGLMTCITDVGGANSDSKHYINEFNKKNFSPGLYASVMYQDFVGLRLQATWGKVMANDNTITSTASPNIISKRLRNLNFRSNIVELALLAEFHPLMLRYYEDGPPRLSPYITAGIGYYSFRPEAYFDGRWVDLKPLSLEGQGFSEYPDQHPYRTSQVNVPIGGGLRYEINNFLNVRAEFLHRVLFTDYLDDASNRRWINPALFDKYLSPLDAEYAKVLYDPRLPVPDPKVKPSRRGNPDDNDAYMSFSIHFGITIGRQTK